MSASSASRAAAAIPVVFILLWSTGPIGAKLGLPFAGPWSFLTLRLGFAGLLLLAFVLLFRAPWPASWASAGHIAVAGLLLHGIYLGGVFAAIHHGVEAGVAALIVATQPLLVAAAAGLLLDERVTARQWLGLALGLSGVALVVWRKLDLGLGTPLGMALSIVALFAIAASTLYQKRFCGDMPLRSGNVIQFAAAGLFTGLLALLLDEPPVVWSGTFVWTLLWLALPVSLGAFTLLYVMIRQGAASRVASLFFLAPPATALMGWLLFGERFGPLALVGMGLVVAGVALVNLGR